MIIYKFPIDHFGIAGDRMIGQLLNSPTKRERKIVRNSLVLMAKASGQINLPGEVTAVGLTIDKAGQKWLTFILNTPGAEDEITIGGG